MTFKKQLTGYTAADLMAALPGIPRSTAYDWLSGERWPLVYLQPVIVAHLRAVFPEKTKKGKTSKTKAL